MLEIKPMQRGNGPGVVIGTHTSHSEDLGSNPVPEKFTNDVGVIVTTSFERKGMPLIPRKKKHRGKHNHQTSVKTPCYCLH